ncbi:MAG TPA: sodium:proton antiporter [Phycisphaerae bacterium]|nr:sodium:proton antiporter [Phycisphaerae bacterium]
MTQSPPKPADSRSRSAPLLHLGHPDAHVPMFEAPESASAPVTPVRLAIFIGCAVFAAFLGLYFEGVGDAAVTPQVALPWVLPFVLLLGCIATMPFVAKHFWEKHYHHVALALACLITGYYLLGLHAGGSMAKSFGEYISFIFLLGSLFTVSGGILIRVRRKATPKVNVALLLAGALIANVFGTTGAAMLLIRPYLRINKAHLRPYHIIFFIFLVANVGGSLTPIGDPPLFLGYLKGVPFWWVLYHCWPMWIVAVGVLLITFFIIDTRAHAAEPREDHDPHDAGPAISIFGVSNLLLVFAILAGILLHDQLVHIIHIPWRELIMTVAVAISLATTPQRIHLENVFNFAPIREVAFLFIGIFATMVPALNFLSNHANDTALREYLQTPGQFYYKSGALSSVLDNAPTYLTFLETETGKLDKNLQTVAMQVVADKTRSAPDDADYARLKAMNPEKYADPAAFDADKAALRQALLALEEYHGDAVTTGALTPDQVKLGFLLGEEKLNWYIVAISLGSVFFGAMTYIGNGPNFMVKSIADHAGAPTPSFFEYIYRYSAPILLPILILVWALFLLHRGG